MRRASRTGSPWLLCSLAMTAPAYPPHETSPESVCV